MGDRRLTLTDIADLRAYERERVDFRRHIIALKKVRRIGVGPFITVVFENRDTIRFQIQEMARAEKLMSDEAIETELRIYNPLIPEPGSLAATMFIELVNDDELRHWLPKLVGVERSVVLDVGEDRERVRCMVDPDHEKQLTRDEITASVHYVHFDLAPDQVGHFADGPVMLAVDHAAYRHEVELSDEVRAELSTDLRADPA